MDDSDSKSNWYVMQVMSGQENKVYESIQFTCSRDSANVVPEESGRKYHCVFKGLVYGVYELNIPYERIEERKQGRKTVRERKLYPGYILLRMRLYDDNDRLIPENWTYIKDTKGVIGLIGGQAPVPLSPHEVAEMTRIQDETDETKAKPKVQYTVGESVIIKEGAFESCEGVIENVDQEHGKLRVSVSIFGRFTPVEVEFWQVERP